MVTMARPAPPGPNSSHPGFEWVPTEETGSGTRIWTADSAIVEGKVCRYGSPFRGYCGRPAVAALNRSSDARVQRWYGYCDRPEHLYGRWLEDGRVMCWRLRRIAPTTVGGTDS